MENPYLPKRQSARAFAAQALAALVAIVPAAAQAGGERSPPAAAQTEDQGSPPAAAETGVEAAPPAAAQTEDQGSPPAAAETGGEAASPAPALTPGKASPPAAASPSSLSAKEITTGFVKSAIPTVNFIATASRLAIGNSPSGKIQKLAGELAQSQTAVANSLTAWVNVSTAVVTLRSPFTGQIGPGTDKLSAPRFLPAQVTNLQRLSAVKGKEFDSLFVSTAMEALVQLRTLYRDFLVNGTDPGLRAIATRELPAVEQAISEFDKL